MFLEFEQTFGEYVMFEQLINKKKAAVDPFRTTPSNDPVVRSRRVPVDPSRLGVELRALADDGGRGLVGAHRAVGAQAEEDGLRKSGPSLFMFSYFVLGGGGGFGKDMACCLLLFFWGGGGWVGGSFCFFVFSFWLVFWIFLFVGEVVVSWELECLLYQQETQSREPTDKNP